MTVLEDRYWTKVARGAPGECWLWTGYLRPNGYGQFRMKPGAGVGTREGSHRAAWIFTHGSIPEGMNVLHRCDRPACCNPSHLFLGTQSDNNRDAISKGRRLSPKQYRERLRAA